MSAWWRITKQEAGDYGRPTVTLECDGSMGEDWQLLHDAWSAQRRITLALLPLPRRPVSYVYEWERAMGIHSGAFDPVPAVSESADSVLRP